MAIRDVDLSNRQTHLFVAGHEALFPRNDLYPSDSLYPVDSGIYLSNNIVYGTMKLDEFIVDGNNFVFGNLYATKFEVQVFGSVEYDGQTLDMDDIDFHGKFIYLYQEDNGVFKRLFTGIVDSAKKNKDGLDKTLVAYDSAYTLSTHNVADWWTSYWSSTALMYNQGDLDMAVAFYDDATSGVETYLNSIYPATSYNQRYALNLYNGSVYYSSNSAWAYSQTLTAGAGNKVKLIDKTTETPVTVYKTPLGTLRESVLDYLGVTYEDVLLTNDYLCVSQDVELQLLTFGTLIRMICELNCCFPHFNRENTLIFIVLDVEATASSINGLYAGPDSTFEEFVTTPITGIQFLNSDGDVKYVVGQTDNVYTPSADNIFIFNFGTDDLKLAGNNMLAYVSDLSYRPCDIQMVVGDLQYNLGDRITTEQGTHFILQNSYSGAQFVNEEISCGGQEIIKEVARPVDTSLLVVNQRISKIVYDVEHFYTEFTQYKTTTNGTISELSTSLTQTAEAVTIEAHSSGKEWDTSSYTIQYYGNTDPTDGNTKASGYPANGNNNKYYLNKVNGKLYKSNNSTWVLQTTLTLLQASVNSQFTQTANAISLKVSSSDYNHATIVAKINDSTSSVQISADKINLTGYATFTSLSTAGQTTINGANITTGMITSTSGSTKYNYWNLSGDAFRVGDSTRYILKDSSNFKIYNNTYNHWDLLNGTFSLGSSSGYIQRSFSGSTETFKIKHNSSDNEWNLTTGRFSVQSGNHYIYLSGTSNTSAFKIYADANNYWDLLTGQFKTNNGTFTGSITASSISGGTISGTTITGGSVTSESGSKKIVLQNGMIKGYYGNTLKGELDVTTDGFTVGGIFGSYFKVSSASNKIEMAATDIYMSTGSSGNLYMNGYAGETTNLILNLPYETITLTIKNGLITGISSF